MGNIPTEDKARIYVPRGSVIMNAINNHHVGGRILRGVLFGGAFIVDSATWIGRGVRSYIERRGYREGVGFDR